MTFSLSLFSPAVARPIREKLLEDVGREKEMSGKVEEINTKLRYDIKSGRQDVTCTE